MPAVRASESAGLAIPTAAITDEFSPDLDVALDAMVSVGMTGAELRVIGGRNILDLTDDEVDARSRPCEARGMTVPAIASPLLKCTLPHGPAIDARLQQDVFGSPYSFDDQPRLTRRAFDIAERTGARHHSRLLVLAHRRSAERSSTMSSRRSAALADEAQRRALSSASRTSPPATSAQPTKRRACWPRSTIRHCRWSGTRRMPSCWANGRTRTATRRCRWTASPTSTRRTAGCDGLIPDVGPARRDGPRLAGQMARFCGTATRAGSASKRTGEGPTATVSRRAGLRRNASARRDLTRRRAQASPTERQDR